MFRNNCVKPFSLIQAIYAMAWVTVLLLMSLATAQAGQVTLAWNASTSAGVTGYHVVYGQASNNYTTQVDAGNSTQYTVTNLQDGTTYYFAVHAHDAGDTISSANSNEVSKSFATVAPPPGGEPPSGGLVAAYHFDETTGTMATDVSGNGNHGTINGATRTTGKFGQALSFNGSSNWITIPDADSLDLTNGMALSAWVYPTALSANINTVLAKENGANVSYDLMANDDMNVPQLYLGGSTYLRGTGRLPLNAWSHIASTFYGSTVKLFVNGIETASLSWSGSLSVGSGQLLIGKSPWSEYFQGRIDEVRIYNRALNASEILADMNNPVTGNNTTVQYTFTTQPSGLTLNYGGVSRVTPFTVDATVGSEQTISAPANQQNYNFSAWSDGGTATHIITVGSSPKTYTATYAATVAAPTANFNANQTSGVAPLAISFTDTSTGTVTAWSWNFGDGTTSTDRNPSKTYTKAGAYTVTLTASNSSGSDAETKTGYIEVTEPAPVARISASSTSGTAPLLVTFTDTSTGSIASRSWDFGNGTASTAQTAMVTYNTPGTYTVKLTVTGSSGVNTAFETIVVTAAPPVADFNANPVTGMAPLAATFTNTSSGTTTSYQWDFGDGSTSTVAYPTHTYTKAGTYTVKLTATGPAGSNTKTKTGYITVAGGGLVAAYNFNEASGATVVDASGQGNHGTINGATRSTTGKFGKALSFDGVNDWVSIPDADLLDLTTAMTLEAWVYPKNLADRRPILSKQGTTNGTPTRGFMFSAGDYSGTGKVEVELFKNETNSSSLRSTTALNTSGWQHVAFVYQYVADGTSKMTIYINGVVKGSSTAAVGPVQKNAQPLALGRYYWNSSYARYFNGLIDEVRIYNRALNASEILADMNKAVAF